MFNKPSDWYMGDFLESRAAQILSCMPGDYTDTTWVSEENMTSEEKDSHEEYKTIGGFLRVDEHKADRQLWWDELIEEDKEEVMRLPNFDKDIFKQCTGIEA